MRILIKLGGTLLDEAEPRLRLASEIAEIAAHSEYQTVVVHGGGKQMTRFLAERGVESRFVNGLRVTTPEVIDAVLKIFRGTVNAHLVTALRAAGASPVGLSGLDAGLVDAEILDSGLGQVGKPVKSDARLLEILTSSGYLPVVACIAGDARGAVYNVNADQMAVACAGSYRADKLLFLTDVEGVRDRSGATLETLSSVEARALIDSGVAQGGMRAKLEAAMEALKAGVGEVRIAPGAAPGIVQSILNGSRIGTTLALSR